MEYCYRAHGADFYRGQCASIEEAKLECIREEELEKGCKLEVAEVVPWPPTISADLILENLQDEAYEEIGEPSEDWFSDITDEQALKLENAINEVIQAWMKETNHMPNFFSVGEVKEYVITKEEMEKAKASATVQ